MCWEDVKISRLISYQRRVIPGSAAPVLVAPASKTRVSIAFATASPDSLLSGTPVGWIISPKELEAAATGAFNINVSFPNLFLSFEQWGLMIQEPWYGQYLQTPSDLLVVEGFLEWSDKP